MCSEADRPSILLLDDDDDLREMIGDALSQYDIADVVAVPSVASMIEHEPQALASALAILDMNLGAGKPSGVDAYAWLIERGFRGKVVFLTGHAANHPLVQEARRQGAVRVLQKPISLHAIRNLLDESKEAHREAR